jgi:hypothetical protein
VNPAGHAGRVHELRGGRAVGAAAEARAGDPEGGADQPGSSALCLGGGFHPVQAATCRREELVLDISGRPVGLREDVPVLFLPGPWESEAQLRLSE